MEVPANVQRVIDYIGGQHRHNVVAIGYCGPVDGVESVNVYVYRLWEWEDFSKTIHFAQGVRMNGIETEGFKAL